MEPNAIKKHKISLEDYPLKQDLENRLLMAQFTPQDLPVLEEILYSSIKVPIRKLAKNVDLTEEELLPILMKLSKSGLFSFEEDSLILDKDLRKYFEGQIGKFDPDFKPGMDYIQNLLKKVPIHVLPIWYSIPRLSNDIFESIIEKYLLTPQIFQRYLADLTFADPVLSSIMKDVYQSPELKVEGKDLIEKYNLSKEQFEEALLQLEFHLVCCLRHEKQGEEYKQIVTPFQEWKDYVHFLKSTQTNPISPKEKIERKRPDDFSYVKDLSQLLSLAKKQPFSVSEEKGKLAPASSVTNQLTGQMKGLETNNSIFSSYLHQLIAKAIQLKLAAIVDGRLHALETATDFLEMTSENQAIFLYRHPLNRQALAFIYSELLTDRTLREAEKSILRVLSSGWVYFDEFLKGVTAALNENSIISLKKQGKTWRYNLPSYSEEEIAFIRAVVLEWLFETGITAVGHVNGRECFCVTPFGQSLFGQ